MYAEPSYTVRANETSNEHVIQYHGCDHLDY